MTAAARMMDVGIRLQQFREDRGNRLLIEFLRRNEPESRDEFITQLYSDLRSILDTLQRQAHHLLRKEEWLRDQVRNMLSSRGYDTGSEQDYRGHSDLLVKHDGKRFYWIGEAKIHSTYDYLNDGMLQLHTRYTVGIEGDCGLIIFLFNQNANLMMTRWKSYIEDNKVCNHRLPFGSTDDALDFISLHDHHSGLKMATRHFICYLFYDPKDNDETEKTSKASN